MERQVSQLREEAGARAQSSVQFEQSLAALQATHGEQSSAMSAAGGRLEEELQLVEGERSETVCFENASAGSRGPMRVAPLRWRGGGCKDTSVSSHAGHGAQQ